MNDRSVADLLGPWVEPNFKSGLIDRCRKNWAVPISQLSNEMIATFLRQDIATEWVLAEAEKRLSQGFIDGSERYDEELANAANDARERLKTRA